MPGCINEAVGELARFGHVSQPPPHETLERGHGVGRIVALRCQRGVADLAAAAFGVMHGAGQQHAALLVGQAFGHAMAHRGHERVRRAQVDAHGDAALVRIGRLAGFGNLQQGHGSGRLQPV
jgi:hypothetical protein